MTIAIAIVVVGCGGRRVEPAPREAASPSPSSSVATTNVTAPDAGRAAAIDPLIAEATFALPIPARAQAAESPPSGWCGETAIQEGLLYLGVWAPQRLINKAGKPVHADLYATEIPTALSELGVRFTPYGRGKGYDAYARWVQSALEEGDPVLAGVKILPTEHPDWGLDHFVLAIGHGKKGLLVNTTWGHREWVGDTTTPGLSLKNAFYGLRLHGLRLPANGTRAHVALLDEGAGVVKVRVTCMNTKPGQAYRMERRARAGSGSEPARANETSVRGFEAQPVWSEIATEMDLSLDADQASRFHCVAM